MLIEVTRQLIDEGERGSRTRCPIALAARRTQSARKGHEVSRKGIRAPAYRRERDGTIRQERVRIPWNNADLTGWIERYDAGKSVPPVTLWQDAGGQWRIRGFSKAKSIPEKVMAMLATSLRISEGRDWNG